MSHNKQDSSKSEADITNFNHTVTKKKDAELLQRSSSENKFYSIVILCGCSISLFISIGLIFTLGTYLPEWLNEFRGSHTTTAAIQSVGIGLNYGAGTVVGIFTDKCGIRPTIMLGSILSSMGYLAAVFAPNLTLMIITIGVMTGIGGCSVYLGTIVVISRTFQKFAPLCLTCVHSAAGLGVVLLPFLHKYLIEEYGWRGAMYILAGLSLQPLAIGYITTYLMKQLSFNTPQSDDKIEALDNIMTLSKKLRQIFRPRYITVICSIFVAFLTSNGFFVIVADFAKRRNQDGALFLTILSSFSTTSSVVIGAMVNFLKWLNPSVVYSVLMILLGISFILLEMVDTYISTFVFIAMFGFAFGGLIGMTAVVVLDIVGATFYPTAIGFAVTMRGIGSSIGGILFGFIYDSTSSYSMAFIIMGSVSCVFGMLPAISVIVNRKTRKTETEE